MPETSATDWLSASVAVVIPFDDSAPGDWRSTVRGAYAWPSGENLALPHSGVKRAAAPDVNWFSGAIRGAITTRDGVAGEARCEWGSLLDGRRIGPDRKTAGTRFAELGLELFAVEVRCYPRGVGERTRRDAFAIVHVGVMDDSAAPFDGGSALIADPGRIARAIRRPLFESEFGREFCGAITALLSALSIKITLEPGGYVKEVDRERQHSFPFTITHAVAEHDALPRPALLAEHEAWQDGQKWSYEFATGSRAGVDVPHDSASAAASASPEISHLTECRVDLFGAGFVGRAGQDRALGAPVNNRIRTLVHTRYLDIFLLVLRQKAALTAHELALADAARATGGDDLGALLSAVETLDRGLVDFRLNLWFTQVPEHGDGTALLRELQSRLGLQEQLDELAQSQGDLRSLVQLHARRAEERERERVVALAAGTDRRERRFTSLLAVLGAAAVAPSIVFGFTAVAVQPDWTAAGIGAGIAVLGSITTFAVVRRWMR